MQCVCVCDAVHLYMYVHAHEIYNGSYKFSPKYISLACNLTNVVPKVSCISPILDILSLSLPHYRASVDRSLPVGGAAAASEQLQPVYETKSLVAEQAKKMEVIMTQLKVRCTVMVVNFQ